MSRQTKKPPCPHIPPALLTWLDYMIPERSPRKHSEGEAESYEALLWRGGQREVVNLLLREAKKQQEIARP